MSYSPVTLTRFGGLNLRDDPQEVGFNGAVDLLNVQFDKPGRVRQRDGYIKYTASAGAAAYDSLHFSPVAELGARGTTVEAFSAGTASTSVVKSVGGHYFASFGSSSTSAVYCANGTDTVFKYSGGAFSAPAGMPTAKYIAVQSPDNRLAVAKTSTSVSRVQFSGENTPEVWGANDYVDLTAGDGENIYGLVAWKNYLFAFKQTKFFVFYGNSTDTAGDTKFNYRAVASGIGLAAPGACVAGRDGVYFVSSDGVYRTTGGEPELVSGALDPFFKGGLSNYFGIAEWYGGATGTSFSTPRLAWAKERLYVAVAVSGSSTPAYLLVLTNGQWSVWDMAAYDITSDSSGTVYFADAGGSKHIHKLSDDYTTDNGTSITSRYRTGFVDLGVGTEEKYVRELVMDGIGSVGVSVMVNDASTVPTATTVALGTSPATANGRYRKAFRGRNFGVRLASVSGGAWTVNQLTAHVRNARPPGAKSS